MTSVTITITDATSAGVTAEVLTDAERGITRMGVRTLIANLAAAELGITLKQMREVGYDVYGLADGWDMKADTIPGGRRRLTYTLRPLTPRERREKLSREGGFVENADGSMGFILPQPRAKAVPVTVRQQGEGRKPRKTHKAPEPQSKPAEPTSPERMKRPRLK